MNIRTPFIMASVIVLFALFSLSVSNGGTVVIKPGRFDHFTLQIPERLVAGEGFVVKVQVYDVYNNLITNFSESDKEFVVSATGSATVQPFRLSPAMFPGGTANITVTDKKSETLAFSIREAGGTVPVISREVTIVPNRLDHFVVLAPSSVSAGMDFDIKIIAKDTFDNTVGDEEMLGRSVRVRSGGAVLLKTAGKYPADFNNGVASMTLVAEKTGRTRVEVQESSIGASGHSHDFIVYPGALSSFKVYAPERGVAGEPFDVTIAAYDAFGNAITNYSSNGNGVALRSSGSAKIEPSFIKASEFRGNEAVVRAVYDKAEEITLVARENNSDQEGRSRPIGIMPGAADHFVVDTPENAVAGQSFKIRVAAYDRFNNVVRDYNLSGSNVVLRATGSGSLSPSVVLASDFVDGIAVVEVSYDRAESFSISAQIGSSRPQERITVRKMHGARKESPPAEGVHEKRREKRPKETGEREKVQLSKGAQAGECQGEGAGEAAKGEKSHIQEFGTEESGRASENKPGHAVRINDVSVIEAKEKAILLINTESDGEKLAYESRIESNGGRNWLMLNFRPASREAEKTFRFKSQFIDAVVVEKDKGKPETVNVSVELLPEKVDYTVQLVKNNIVVTVSKP